MDEIADEVANSSNVLMSLVETFADCGVLQRAVWHALRWEAEAGEMGEREECALRADFARALRLGVPVDGACAGGAGAKERGAACAKESDVESKAFLLDEDGVAKSVMSAGAGGDLYEDEDGDVANEFLVEGPTGFDRALGAKAVAKSAAEPESEAGATREGAGAGGIGRKAVWWKEEAIGRETESAVNMDALGGERSERRREVRCRVACCVCARLGWGALTETGCACGM